MTDAKDCGIVAVIIGRNEGERLRRCLESCTGRGYPVVYVDSASTDGSVQLAQSLGADVVELDGSQLLSAARARNAGFKYARGKWPGVKYVQFIDGDCELAEGWIERALQEHEDKPETAIVCGRVHERERDQSIYSRLCDMEWNTQTGEVEESGGIFIIKAEAMAEVDGFNENLIGGEEPELCLRLRRMGHKIIRLTEFMALHDSNITRWKQWWLRSVRTGMANSQSAALHRNSPERHAIRVVHSSMLWGVMVPLLAIAGIVGLIFHPAALVAVLVSAMGYAMLTARIYRRRRKCFKDKPADARLYALFCMLSKFPQFYGVARYNLPGLFRRSPELLTYKDIELKRAG